MSQPARSGEAGPLFMGLDAGGSSCRARLTDPLGAVFGEGHAGPGAARLGIEASFEAMMTAAREAWRAAGLGPFAFGRVRAGAGIAGFRRAGVAAAFGARPHPFASFDLSDDGTIACLGAHGGEDGGVVITGTGSIAYGLVGDRALRFGGYGFPGSDEGSGARLGLAAIRAAFFAVDGREAQGPFTAAILARFDGDVARIIAWCDVASPSDYAGLAPIVVEHAGRGDPVAFRLVRQAGEAVAALIEVLGGAGCERVALAGGLALPLRPFLPATVDALLAEPVGDALDGALMLAGLPPVEMSASML